MVRKELSKWVAIVDELKQKFMVFQWKPIDLGISLSKPLQQIILIRSEAVQETNITIPAC